MPSGTCVLFRAPQRGSSTALCRNTAASARASTGRWCRWSAAGPSFSRVDSTAATSPRRSVPCIPGASTSRAASSRRKASRTPLKWPLSSQRSAMRMYDLPDERGHFGPYGGVIAETGAGMHGVATATVAARYGMECVVYMGSEDVKRQVQNVYRMKLLGASVVPVESGSRTLKDALSEAMRDWVTHVERTFYIIGTVAGPHPYPMMVRDFQSVIGEECLAQMQEMSGRQPDAVIACVGGGSNAMGIFYPYLKTRTRLIGVEAAGEGLETGRHAASLCAGKPGVLHGNRTYLLQDANGQITETHSISAGLDYPGVGPEHAWLKDSGRAEYVAVTDEDALRAFHDLCRKEGIIPALESAHALAQAMKMAPGMPKDAILLVNLSGRGDKDMHTVAQRSGIKF